MLYFKLNMYLCTRFSLHIRESFCYLSFVVYSSAFIISRFALSISDASNDARYILVVFSELCPIASLITDSGTCFSFAMDAQACRATYVVSGLISPTMQPMSFSFLFVRRSALLYCLRLSSSAFFIIGSRYGPVSAAYLSTMSCIMASHLILSICPVFRR